MNVPRTIRAAALGFLLLATACSGGTDGTAPIDEVALRSIEPEAMTGQSDTVLTLDCDAPEDVEVFLQIGDATFPVTIISEDVARVTIPAGELAPGRYDLVLVVGDVRSETIRDGLEVMGAPQLNAFDPPRIDRELRMPFVLSGRHLVGPLTVRFLDSSGTEIGTVAAAVSADGREARGLTVTWAGDGDAAAQIQVVDGEGRSADRALDVVYGDAYRSIDGSGNNLGATDRGAAGIALLRKVAANYADGIEALDATRPNPRAVSNGVFDQGEDDIPNSTNASDYLWQWGQFLDHDIDLSLEAEPEEAANIPVPTGDPDFDPAGDGGVFLSFHRSAFVPDSAPREQTNSITAYIDASNVYGSDDARAGALRTNDGTGRLLVSDGDLLPFNESGLPNAGGPSPTLFVAGDVRANEQVGLLAMHTLFVREHNRLADEIGAEHPSLSGEEIYQAARRIVSAQMQVVTFREFLPVLLGPNAVLPYRGYDANEDASIANVFSTAGYRLGHSLLSPTLLRIDATGLETAAGHLSLSDAFFSPTRFVEGGLDPILRGLGAQRAQELDAKLVDDVRNFLFGAPGAGGLDLASLNIQRGRDHGLGSYNDARAAYGLARVTEFDQITSDPDVAAQLAAVYANVDEIDVWVGSLAEDDLRGSMVGALLNAILTDQFERLRDADRFWHERTLAGSVLDRVRRTKLSDIVRRNTAIGSELSDDVFHVGTSREPDRRPRAGSVSPERELQIRRRRRVR